MDQISQQIDAETWSAVCRIFDSAREVSTPDQRALVEQLADGNARIVNTVLAMLESDRTDGSILDESHAETASRLLQPLELAGSAAEFGPYRLIDVLGQGGMGVVYRARRADVGAEVAIKVLWDAPLSPERGERFVEEQRVLASLRHPGIVPLYDAGVTPDGTRWFAMELVTGDPLTNHCKAQQLPVRERLRLFRTTCASVAAAHGHLVVHGDLKPSNVLVSQDGHVRLLDFGGAHRIGNSLSTSHTARHLTPAYASPQSMSGAPACVSDDIFSLGILLFELLTDSLPSPTSHSPPALLESVTPLRRNSLGRNEDWGDLNRIVRRATALDITARYASVDGLIQDLDRYREGYPLASVDASLGYLVRKFVRRRALRVSFGVLAVLLSAGGLAAHERTLRSARDEAIAEAARTSRLKAFLESLFQGGGAELGPIDSVRVTTLLANGIREARALINDAATQIDLLESLGIMSERMGQLERADTLISTAVERSRTAYGAAAPRTLQARARHAQVQLLRGRADSAELLLRKLEVEARELPDRRHPAVAEIDLALGVLLRTIGRGGDAVPYLRRASTARRSVAPISREYVEALRELGNAAGSAGNLVLADSAWLVALPVAQSLLGPRHPDVAFLLTNLGNTASQRGDLVVAERYQRESVAILDEWYGTEHYLAAAVRSVLAQTLVRANRSAEAVPLLNSIIAVYSRSTELSLRQQETAIVRSTLANALTKLGRFVEARAEFGKAVVVLTGTLGPGNTSTLNSRAGIARLLILQGFPDSAVVLTAELMRIAADTNGEESLVATNMRLQHGLALAAAGRQREAIGPLSSAIARLDSLLGDRKAATRNGRIALAKAYAATGDSARGGRLRAEADSLR